MSPDPEQAPRQQAGPQPLHKPARSALTMRDMVVALGVLLVVILLAGGVTRSYSFAPTGPTVDPSGLPVVDAPSELRALRVPFPVRVPAVPDGWRSNSVGQDRVEGGRAVRVGFITPAGRYLRLLQSDAPDAALLAVETGATPVAASGPVDVTGQRWIVYPRGSDEPIWITEVATPGAAPVRMLITGSGSEDDFRALAGGALAGELLPARAP